MKAIIHCDDLGFTPQITNRILNVWRRGLIDSVSILANGHALREVKNELDIERDKKLRIAVHLNLSAGKALSKKENIPLITDKEGKLNCTFGGILKKWTISSKQVRLELLKQVEREWKAQINAVENICAPRRIDAVDGHNHIHMLPFLFPIAARLAKDVGISEIRVSREVFYILKKKGTLSKEFAINIIKHIVLRICAKMVVNIVKFENLKGPEGIVGVLYTGIMTRDAVMSGIEAARRKGKGYVEVIFHIGRATKAEMDLWNLDPGAAEFSMSSRRDMEYRELINLKS